jgi:probable F420-dependent oxidoreductase
MTLPVQLGLNLASVQPHLVVRYATFAEEIGFESVWIGEHICVPAGDDWWQGPEQEAHLGDDPEEAANRKPFEPDSPFLDPMAALAHLAGVTKTIRLATGIYMLPLRHPLLTAKMAATVDVLSGGRFELGIGLGWLPAEYQNLDVDWAARGRICDESLACIQALLSEAHPSFAGEFFNFPPIGFEPKPVQRPLPILIGGEGKAAFRRAGQYGTGWYGAPEHNQSVGEQLDRFGRSDLPFTFSSISVGMVGRAFLEEAADLGTDRCVVTPWLRHSAGEVGEGGFAELETWAKTVGLLD